MPQPQNWPTPVATSMDPSVFLLAGQGRTFELSSGWWPGMPLAPGHPNFQVLTFRTPMGERNQADLEFLSHNPNKFGFISEVLSFCAHSGTHIDALCHITLGENDEWHGGYSAHTNLGDFGPLTHDASTLPPFICRGVLVDAPALTGRTHLDPGEFVDAATVEKALTRQGTELKDGDAVFIRTGMMNTWPDVGGMAKVQGAGLTLDGAELLAQMRPLCVGGDTGVVEAMPSGVPDEPQPVHRLMIHDLGIPLLEWVYLEGLSQAAAYEFLFLCLPIPITGATGSLVRPVAIA